MAETKPIEPWRKHGMPFPLIVSPWLATELKNRGEWNVDLMIEQIPIVLHPQQMRDEGYHDPKELWRLLESWRARKQKEWLATDYVNPKMWRM